MRNLLVASLLVFIQISIQFECLSQTETYSVSYLDSRDGLSNSSVNYVFHDSDSLLWLATWDGLNVYDGSGFRVYNYKSSNTSISIGNNLIQQIAEDKYKNIWVATIEGITRFQKTTGKFNNYFYTPQSTKHVTEDQFFLVPDAAGNLYSFSRGAGLFEYDNITDTFVNIQLPLNVQGVRNLFFDESGKLWILEKTGELSVAERVEQEYKLTRLYSDRVISGIFRTAKKVFITDDSNQLFSIDPHSRKIAQIARLTESIKSIVFYNSYYVIANESAGLVFYDESFAPITLPNSLQSLAQVQVKSLSIGSENILWCGTDGNGIIKIYPRQKYFGTVSTLWSQKYSNKPVRAFADVNGQLWIGTKGSGIMAIPTDSNAYMASEAYRISEVTNSSVYSMEKGFSSMMYIGTEGPGITMYDMAARRFYNWADIQGSERYSFQSVYSIYQDADSSLWLGTSGYGLINIKFSKTATGKWKIHRFKQYTYDGGAAGPANDIIYSIAKGSRGYLWVGCRYGGLSHFDPKKGTFVHYRAFSEPGNLSHNDVLSVHVSADKTLWVGTSYGLNVAPEPDVHKQESLKFRRITTTEGLPNNTIHGIATDHEGHAWVSTNKGIGRINRHTYDIVMFTEADGLQSNEFSDGSVWTNSQGYIFFGGINGFNFFLPDNIKYNKAQPNLLISELSLPGVEISEHSQRVVSHATQAATDKFTIERSGNFIQFKVSPVCYINPEKVVFAYQLEHFENDWRSGTNDGKVSYTNLPPGEYSLKIKWSLGDGRWTDEHVVFDVEVQQYMFLNKYAIALYVIIIVSAGFVFARYRKNRQEINHQLSLEHKMRQKDRQLHQEKLDFFTNVAHELQTPLTLIAGSLERYQYKKADNTASAKEKNYFLSIVNQQTAKLTYLLQQLFEFRKAENGHLKKYPVQVNVSSLLENILELFIPYAESKGLFIEASIQSDIVTITDKDKLEKIIYNLLSNSIRHSSEKGIITIRLQIILNEELEISISNPGHIPEQQQEQIFKKFYTIGSDVNSYSSGIGLAFTKELVHLLDGRINVFSQHGVVCFTCCLPLLCLQNSDLMNQKVLRAEVPSFLLRTAASTEVNDRQLTPVENNKRSLITNLEKESRKSVLIVEDDSIIRFLLKDILEESYIIYEAENGRAALTLMKRILPDLIISDIMMPDMDGLQLCNIVKDTPQSCHIPFILLTAKSDIDQKVDGYEAGADAYISKPFHTPHLLIRIKRLLDYKERVQQALKTGITDETTIDVELESEDKQFLERLMEVITCNLDNELLDPEFLEKEMYMSKKQFYRKLKTISNMTPTEFIRHVRLQKAAHYLRSTQLTVSEIFYKTGFNNQSYFYREFKKEFQHSPKEYRDMQKISDTEI